MTNRIGIFAGTFDPVHDGHIAFAKAAIKAANLDKLYFLPEPEPRQKTGVSPLKHRAEMLRLATKDYTQMGVIKPQDKQFTIASTLPKLQSQFPEAELTFLFGSDVAKHLQAWPGADDFLRHINLVVAVRDGDQTPHGLVATIIPTTHTHVVASHVRLGHSDAVPPAVRDYIAANGLYKV